MMTNQAIKQEAKQVLKSTPKKASLFLTPVLLLIITNSLTSTINSDQIYPLLFPNLLTIFNAFFLASASITMLDIYRKTKTIPTFSDSSRAFSRPFIGKFILVELLKFFYILLPQLVLGSLLGLIFGFIVDNIKPADPIPLFLGFMLILFLVMVSISAPLYYSFSQSTLLLYDQVQNQTYQNPHKLLMASRQLMAGHRKQAFLLDVSFIGWFILTIFLSPILIYCLPYYTTATTIFYNQLVTANNQTQ
ncbi:DUF975 family protein [Streptococcus cuniculipharyngis]|nr:DUF975 family protein [Streptococcus cuniculipharyngis]